MSRKPNTTCKTCGVPTYVSPKYLDTRGFCSKKCYGASIRTDRKCRVCGRELNGTSSRSTTCSRTCANRGRVGIKYTGDRLKDNYLKIKVLKEKLIEERGNGCEKCGYKEYPILNLHHKVPVSEGGTDELFNLTLLCPNCHAVVHLLEKLGKSSRLETAPLLKSDEV